MSDKKKSTLRIGKIPYANLFPIYHYLEDKCRNAGYKFVKGVPSALNKMLRDGKIDVSPSSSIEFLKCRDKYSIIPWLSLSAEGPVCSIFLFSKYPLESLNKKSIAVSSQSETSVALLKVLLRDFYSLRCKFKEVNSSSVKKILSDFSACLLIGDDAMKEEKKVKSYELRVKSENKDNPSLYVYDLGELWFKHTGLPFVFALWIVKKKTLSEKKELIRRFTSDLVRAKGYAYKKFPLIAKHASQKKWLSEKELVQYWKCISYDFTDRHMEGLCLFEQYAFKKRD
ncbi:MAG: menaquinone biosynthesis protein [Nitrospirae bacterium]|nr:menaquinone biosynthesis protein [Nitrospirota bacterium]